MEQLFLQNEYANCHEIRPKDDVSRGENDNCLRVFRTSPERIDMQVRAVSALSPWGRGKERRFYSTISLNKQQIEQLIASLKAELPNL